MHIGWNGFGEGIYSVYWFFCHQLPERSFFLFGAKPMYPLDEIRSAWQNTTNPLLLRSFIGNSAMGWKVAWSDRMVSFYTSIGLFGLIWWPLRKKVKAPPWWGLILLLLPIALDGGTHIISDLAGIEQGFRETNQWLAVLTYHLLPASFYTGNALGSFNSWMRLGQRHPSYPKISSLAHTKDLKNITIRMIIVMLPMGRRDLAIWIPAKNTTPISLKMLSCSTGCTIRIST